MLIIPAVDLRGGRVVRLCQGEFDKETVYSSAPEAIVKKWELAGAKLIHVVDLDGAKHGHRQNLGSLKNIVAICQTKIQLGGGLRTVEAVRTVLNAGISRAVIGTKAFDPVFLKEIVRTFHDKIAVGIDLKDNIIQTHGWQIGEIDVELEAFLKHLEKAGVGTIICTDIGRDGMLTGPNFELLEHILTLTQMKVIASGGVSEIKHLERFAQFKAPHFVGVIIGKALYEHKLDLQEAINRFQGT